MGTDGVLEHWTVDFIRPHHRISFTVMEKAWQATGEAANTDAALREPGRKNQSFRLRRFAQPLRAYIAASFRNNS